MLSKFFIFVLPKILSWQSLSELQVTALDDITDLFLQPTYLFLSLFEIWTQTASSASCVQVLRKEPHVLRGRCSLLSD